MTDAQRYMERYTDDWDFLYKLQKSVIDGTLRMEASHLFHVIYFVFADNSDIAFATYEKKKFFCSTDPSKPLKQDSDND